MDNQCADGSKVLVRQIKGLSGRDAKTKATLQALGLGRIGKQREFTVNRPLWGMLRKVRHLVRVEAK